MNTLENPDTEIAVEPENKKATDKPDLTQAEIIAMATKALEKAQKKDGKSIEYLYVDRETDHT